MHCSFKIKIPNQLIWIKHLPCRNLPTHFIPHGHLLPLLHLLRSSCYKLHLSSQFSKADLKLHTAFASQKKLSTGFFFFSSSQQYPDSVINAGKGQLEIILNIQFIKCQRYTLYHQLWIHSNYSLFKYLSEVCDKNFSSEIILLLFMILINCYEKLHLPLHLLIPYMLITLIDFFSRYLGIVVSSETWKELLFFFKDTEIYIFK